jgi:regulator of RNase E activity RraA
MTTAQNPPVPVPEKIFEKLQRLDTCTVSNAIEAFQVRLRNEGFICGALTCRFPQMHPMLGYAATGRIRASAPPVDGRCYHDRPDWWEFLTTIPAPRVLVLEDVDRAPGTGAFIGEIHANLCLALRCVGSVTNGAVRDLGAVEKTGFHLFSGGVSVSHAYAHIVEFGEPVEIGGLRIQSGDLIHGDRNGVHTIPLSIAANLPKAAEEICRREKELINFAHSSQFSAHELLQRLRAEACGMDLEGSRDENH